MDYLSYFNLEFETLIEGIDGEPGDGIHGDGEGGGNDINPCDENQEACGGGEQPPDPNAPEADANAPEADANAPTSDDRPETEEQKEWMLKNGVWKESESKEKIIAIQK